MAVVLFVILGVHIACVLVVLASYIPIAFRSYSKFVEVAKGLVFIVIIPYVPAIFILAHRLDQFDEWRNSKR